MFISWKRTFAALGVAMLLGAAPAMSAEWTRGTRNGGQITRSVTRDGNIYSGQTTRVGPNGATYTSNSTCRNGFVDRCRRSYSATGPNGRTYSGNTVTARAPMACGPSVFTPARAEMSASAFAATGGKPA